MTLTSANDLSAKVDRLLVRRYVFAGLCASLDSIGLARFAFTPLIPELIQAHWFSATTVAYLAAANLAGYVLGALIGRPIATRLANEQVLRLMMVLISAAFFACAFPLSFSWYFSWRFVSGIAGGVVMVLVAGTILPHVPPARKGAAGGVIFLGLGLGISGSGTIIPLLLELGLSQTWIGLGITSVILTAASWFAWPPSRLAPPPENHNVQQGHTLRFGKEIRLLYLQYALMAAAAVSPMVFLVDFVARGLGQGKYLGAVFWAVYGLGAIAGPPLYGYLADRFGAKPTVTLVSLIMAASLLALFFNSHLVVIGVVTLVIGTFAPGMVPLILARVHEVIIDNSARQNVAWTRASMISAAALALAAYGFSALFSSSGGNHRLLFLSAAAILGISLLVGLASPEKPQAGSSIV
ncbi:YbfB/YjiJ family MFS transporter [Phyllobacterium lublinensis]|uniref:YbfB/YjiJ family MFS transporter n=1 Tax=Phyllobacterium lublinensis TaxID=2875708 RepID=UPI001CCB1239|nr:YbfB/YjiJ family MFS transporter [Phyllobacterium sp. 2063]MBZ9657350.1 MFS transporter [Phyllobacterium sp. 2063]